MNPGALGLLKQRLGRLRKPKVEWDRLDLNAVPLTKLLGKFSEFGTTAGDQHEVVMVAREQLGKFIAESGRGAGDESSLVGCHAQNILMGIDLVVMVE